MSICSTAFPNLPAGVKPLTVTIKTTRALLGVGRTKVWELVKRGDLKTVKIDKRTLIVYGSIERLVGNLGANGGAPG